MPPFPAKLVQSPETDVVESNGYQLGLNLYDLTELDEVVRQTLLVGKLDLTMAIKVDADRLDETAVAFSCSLETAAAIIDILHNQSRKSKSAPVRAYVKRKVWSRISSGAVLTIIQDGKVILNPEQFPSLRAELAVRPIPGMPLPAKRL